MTKNFPLHELTHSITAANMGIKNVPGPGELVKLERLAIYVLQPARDFLGFPIYVSSGYRCLMLNRAIGGARYSQHMLGEAADLKCANNKALFDYILNHLDFDQLIWEFGDDNNPDWVHVSFALGRNRKQVLRAIKKGKKTVYTPF